MGPSVGQVCVVKPQGKMAIDFWMAFVNWNAELQECNGFELAIPGVGVSLFVDRKIPGVSGDLI